MSRRILYLTDFEMVAIRVRGKKVVEIHQFSIDPHGETEFAKYLTLDVKTAIYWIIDTAHEEYHISQIPHVAGKDHQQLMNYKKKRLLGGGAASSEKTPYIYGTVQGREMLGRGDDKVLFTAVNNPTILQPWLNWILTYKVPIVGIYSLPLLSELSLKSLSHSPHLFLVTQAPPIRADGSAGLRQSFFLEHKLQLSRLIPVNLTTPDEYAQLVLKQVIATHRYLENSQRLPTTVTTHLPILILTDISVNAFKSAIQEMGHGLNIQLINYQDLARQWGLHFSGHKLYWHHFVAYQLTRRWYTKNHYAKFAETRYLFYRRLKGAIYLFALLLLSGAVTASWLIWEQSFKLQHQGEVLVEKTRQRQIDIENLHGEVPDLPLNIILLRHIVDMGFHIKDLHISPRQAWEQLSQVLIHHPNLFLEQLEWGIGHSKTDIFSSTIKQITNKIIEEEEEDDALENNNETFDKMKNFLEGLRIYGKIRPFHGDYQHAKQVFTQFLRELETKYPYFWRVEVRLSPYEPNRVLQGQIGAPTQEVKTAPFVIDIFIKHSYVETNS
jgi:hypothetical protein